MQVEYQSFREERDSEILKMGEDRYFLEASRVWQGLARQHKYAYHFEFAGRPLIQYPQDIVAVQEIMWSVRPDLIIETGIAHGGSLAMSAGMLALLDLSDSMGPKKGLRPSLQSPNRTVIGVDVDIREHNRRALESHPFFPWIELVEGSSTDPAIVEMIRAKAESATTVLVMLDSNHTHEHVLAELRAYANLVSRGSYCIVFDTIIEFVEGDHFADRPWGKGNSPMSAVEEFMRDTGEFMFDKFIVDKLGVTSAPGGYLKRT